MKFALVFGFAALIATMLSSCDQPQSTAPDMGSDVQHYDGDDLGLIFSADMMHLRVWSPAAEAMRIKLYGNDNPSDAPLSEFDMVKSDGGTWTIDLPKADMFKYYTVQAQFGHAWRDEVPDPYAKAVGTNGLRGQLIDSHGIFPEGWEQDISPTFNGASEAVIYELHVRDFSIHPASGMRHKGKFLAFAERGTQNEKGQATGLDHLVELGVTHIHLLPVFDFLSIDESQPDRPQYNWGYDPQNYFVPEGSYATDASDGQVRIREFKTMVQSLHRAGLRVVMDVVYNHTGKVGGLSLEESAPGQYYRQWPDGKYSDASGCGNETASDKPMFRKLMIESLKHWMEVYHIDGFRFDLMAIHDQETMRMIESELHAIRPDVLLYGEGWTAGKSPLPIDQQALKKFTFKMPGISAFSDDMRDGIKGSWSDHEAKGYVSGNFDLREQVKFGIVGAISHPDVDSAKIGISKEPWALEPTQAINYVSCHDNHTLMDKLRISNPELAEAELQKLQILSNAMVLTSQGIPFIHAGAEMLRTKQGVENSYKSPDSINAIDWNWLTAHPEVFAQYQYLIALRKAHPGLRLGSADAVREQLRFIDSVPELLGFEIMSPEDSWSKIQIWVNVSTNALKINLGDGTWQTAYLGKPTEGEKTTNTNSLPGRSMGIFYQAASE